MSSFEVKCNRFDGQVAAVTGSGQGIGLGIARRMGQEGALVILLDTNKQCLEESSKSLTAEGIKNDFFVLNVTDESEVNKVFASIVEKHGRLDVLVQSAGVTGKTGIKTEDVELSNFQFVFDVNVKGIFLCCKAVLPVMVKQKYGRIVNIASVAGKEGNAGMLAYSGSKAAVIGMTKSIGKEYAEMNITCNAIAPAVVRTAMVDNMPAEQVKYMTDKIPMKRCGLIEEVAALSAFVSSKEAGFTTGFCFDCTGGRATY